MRMLPAAGRGLGLVVERKRSFSEQMRESVDFIRKFSSTASLFPAAIFSTGGNPGGCKSFRATPIDNAPIKANAIRASTFAKKECQPRCRGALREKLYIHSNQSIQPRKVQRGDDATTRSTRFVPCSERCAVAAQLRLVVLDLGSDPRA